MPRKRYNWDLPPEIESRLGDESYGPQRIIQEAGHLLLILHKPPSEEDLKRESIVFLLTPDHQLLCNGKPGGEAMLTRLISDYRKRWEALENKYHLNCDAADLFDMIEATTPLKRTSANLARAVQAAREASKEYRFLIGIRDAATDLARAFEILLDDLRSAVDFRVAKKAEEQGLRTEEMAIAQHKLNLLAGITFPLMAIATLLGMNLSSGIERQNPFAFWVVLGGGILTGVFVRSWILHKPKKAKTSKR